MSCHYPDQSIQLMKTFPLFLFIIASTAASAQEITHDLEHFTRIVASPRVNVILRQGDHESIRIVHQGITEDDINVKVTGKTLRIFLDHARKLEPMRRKSRYGRRESLYEGASVTAVVTYKSLHRIEIRGNQELTCEGPIDAWQFVVCAYGENEINLRSLHANYFKAKMYGENHLHIVEGKALDQKYVLYGENKIDASALRAEYSFTRIFGEGSLRINSSEQVMINAIGEPRILVDGGAQINRRLVIGDARIDGR